MLPVCEPIAHHTRSRAQAPIALFTSGRPDHEQVKYHIPTAKATHPAEEPLAFAGLCKTYHMKPAEVDAFAFLCEALTLEDGPGLSALSVLDPATGKFASFAWILGTKQPGIHHTPTSWAVSANA